MEIHSFWSDIRDRFIFLVEIHAQSSGIDSQKSDSNHYFGVDPAILSVDFHSTALLLKMSCTFVMLFGRNINSMEICYSKWGTICITQRVHKLIKTYCISLIIEGVQDNVFAHSLFRSTPICQQKMFLLIFCLVIWLWKVIQLSIWYLRVYIQYYMYFIIGYLFCI